MKTLLSPQNLLTTFLLALALVWTGALYAETCHVLPATARPKGFSLSDAARATAYFNTGDRSPGTLPAHFPFQILYVAPDFNLTFTVKPGTMFYVPLVYSDDADGALWPFPDVRSSRAVSDYFYSDAQLGAEVEQVVVDGHVTNLGDRYAVGAVTPGLPTGGNSYTVIAAFINPLPPGTHTVKIISKLSGEFLAQYPEFFPDGTFGFELTYTVIVQR